MRRIAVDTASSRYEVIVGGSVANLRDYIPCSTGLIVAEEIFAASDNLSRSGLLLRTVKGGEQLKELSQIEQLYKLFIEAGLDKSSHIVAVGGGALTDAVAFAAATFHRGMPCITVPTTLLAQVDASIGGKNGINFAGIKNLIGTITQPGLVICDFEFLKTLPRSEISNGISEIIKAGLIADPELLEILKESSQSVFSLDCQKMEEIVSRAVQVKADIVGRDEKESHERMKLNLGHTIGHAIETCCGLSHGQAVACGMILEAKMAVRLGLCAPELVSEIESLCRLYGLPVEIEFSLQEVCRRILLDKKRRSSNVQFALPIKAGQVDIIPVKTDEIEKYISDLCSAQ